MFVGIVSVRLVVKQNPFATFRVLEKQIDNALHKNFFARRPLKIFHVNRRRVNLLVEGQFTVNFSGIDDVTTPNLDTESESYITLDVSAESLSLVCQTVDGTILDKFTLKKS